VSQGKGGVLIGLSGPDESCPVCDTKPQAYRATELDNLVECVRCGLLFNLEQGGTQATPAANPGYLRLFRTYWLETGNRITADELAAATSDPELLGRREKLHRWLDLHPQELAHANLAITAPYSSLTAIVVAMDSELRADFAPDRTKAWNLLVPHPDLAAGLAFPIDPEPFAVGTIVTIQTPIANPLDRTKGVV
jgi:hypothetical protein